MIILLIIIVNWIRRITFAYILFKKIKILFNSMN